MCSTRRWSSPAGSGPRPGCLAGQIRWLRGTPSGIAIERCGGCGRGLGESRRWRGGRALGAPLLPVLVGWARSAVASAGGGALVRLARCGQSLTDRCEHAGGLHSRRDRWTRAPRGPGFGRGLLDPDEGSGGEPGAVIPCGPTGVDAAQAVARRRFPGRGDGLQEDAPEDQSCGQADPRPP